MELSGQRLYRDLFWQLAAIGPFALTGFLVLLIVPRYRRAAAMGLVLGTAGAVIAASILHDNYSLVIWRTHDSAIQLLDTAAACAGFAASGLAYGTALIILRLARRAPLRQGAPP